jgi:predicted Zn-dependent peptidase
MLKRIVCVLLLGALALPAFAEEKMEKETPPVGGTPKPFKVPARQTFELPNGLKVTMVPYGATPKVNVTAIVRAGNINESAEEVWLADITSDLLKEGSKSYTAEQMAQKLAAMGGRLNVNVAADFTSVSSDVLSEFGAGAVTIIADVLQNPLLPESELARIKKDRLRQLSIQRTQPQSLALERFRKTVYGDHPYGRIFPTEQMVEGYTIAQVRKFYGDNFGAQRTRIYVAGQFDAAAMKKSITDAFSGWAKGAAPAMNPPKTKAARAFETVNRPGAAQSTLYIGLPVVDPSHPDYIQLAVMNTLLGGYFSSRVTSNIREAKGYTYSPFSQVSSRYRDAYWVQVADVTTAVTGPSIKEIVYEIERLQKEAPTAAEMDSVRNYIAGVFVFQNSSRQGVIGQLNFADLHGLGYDWIENYVQRVHATTGEQLQQMAQKYLQVDHMTMVVVGDQEKIATQLEPYAKLN